MKTRSEYRGAPLGSDLPPSELEVLRLVCQGLPSKAIAAIRGVTRKTIDQQRGRIMARTGANSPAHLGFIAHSRGLVSDEPGADQ